LKNSLLSVREKSVTHHLQERVGDFRIKLLPPAPLDFCQRLFYLKALSVWPVGHHSVIGVAYRDQSRAIRDGPFGQPVGVAAPVKALVMVPRYLGLVGQYVESIDDFLSKCRMVLHET